METDAQWASVNAPPAYGSGPQGIGSTHQMRAGMAPSAYESGRPEQAIYNYITGKKIDKSSMTCKLVI